MKAIVQNGRVVVANGNALTYEGSSGGSSTTAIEKDVNFIDYDGTIVYSYTKTEFASLSALPANPTHTGLTAQGWNWSLSDAKTYVATYGKLWIGQMYITSSGASEIDIKLNNAGLLSPYLKICVDGTVTIDWGDGSTADTVTGTSLSTAIYTLHTYATIGNYTISISVTSGSFTFQGNYVLSHTNNTSNASKRYSNSVIAIRLGSGITFFGSVGYCYSLQSVTIPSGVISIGSNTFSGCYSLQSVTIPSTVTADIGSTVFNNCYSLQNMTLPRAGTNLNSVFYNCYSLQSVAIPSTITTIGNNAFYDCYSLQSVTIPSGVTSIGNSAFGYCHSLYKIVFKPTTPPTVDSSNAWSSIPTDCVIYVPYSADHSILTAYTTASNYPDSNTYTYVEET